jgi:hypothetical protein
VLVIACSDGRIQEPVDEFMGSEGVTHYDRLYVPGGPGALTSSGVSFMRADHFRRECGVLIAAHGVSDVYLIFHGPAADGPPEATCVDYRLKLPTWTPEQIRVQQQRDAAAIILHGFGWQVNPRVLPFRCEVTAAGGIQFVSLDPADTPSAGHPLSL